MTKEKYKAPALDKGLDILELLSNEPKGLTQKEIAFCLDRNLSEVFRMIVRLQERNYINLTPGSDRYVLTLKMFDLATQHSPINRLTENALPVMNQLASDTKQSCQIGVHSFGQVVIVAQVDSPHRYNFSVRLGTKVDLLDSASGLVLMAFSNKEHQNLLLQSCDASLRESDSLRIVDIKASGICKFSSPVVKGVINYGSPIFNHHGEVIASLTIPYIEKGPDTPDEDQVSDNLIAAANDVSIRMGFNS